MNGQRVKTNDKNMALTVFIVLLCLFLFAVTVIEQRYTVYRENMAEMQKTTENRLMLLKKKADSLQMELRLQQLEIELSYVAKAIDAMKQSGETPIIKTPWRFDY